MMMIQMFDAIHLMILMIDVHSLSLNDVDFGGNVVADHCYHDALIVVVVDRQTNDVQQLAMTDDDYHQTESMNQVFFFEINQSIKEWYKINNRFLVEVDRSLKHLPIKCNLHCN